MIITLSSIGGAPGVTSWALLLAAAWPDPSVERVVLEADPAGGVLGARYGIGIDPGAVGLVASCRRDVGLDVEAHGRPVAEGLFVIPAPELAESAHPLWVTGASPLATSLTLDEKTWLVDLGRLGPTSPVKDLATVAALNIIVTGPHAEQLIKVPGRIEALGATGAAVGVLVAGPTSYGVEELTRFFSADRVWCAPTADDLPQLVARAMKGGRSRRHLVWRSARSIAAEVDQIAINAALSRDALAVGGAS